jgi:hypothetical protein
MRILLGIFLTVAIGLFAYSAAVGATGSLMIAIPIAVIVLASTVFALKKFQIINLEKTAYTRGLQILSAAAIVIALIQLFRLTVFMLDAEKVQYSSVPWSRWEFEHSCLTAYYTADNAVGVVPDIYSNSLYSMPDDDPKSIRKPRMLGPFRVDVYEYPPTFLFLPRFFSFISHDFSSVRMLWFGFNGALVLIAMLMVARSLGSGSGTRALLLIPVVWAALPTIGTLQKGNVQLIIVALSMIAMLYFARQKFSAGGLLLAFTTASKIYPGMLILYLLLRRHWRAVISTVIAGISLALITLYVMGMQSFVAFNNHLPGLLSGQSFPAFRDPAAVAINLSIPGIVLKLKLFGVEGMDFTASKIVGWIYTLVLIAIIFVVARRNNKTGLDNPIVWLAILILATLRSPFLPQGYAPFPPLWLLTLLFATQIPKPKTMTLFILAWLCMNILIPSDAGVDPRLSAIIITIPQAVTIAIALLALRQPKHELVGKVPVM